MAKFRMRYEHESIRIMTVEAENEAEARIKFEDYDCIDDYEDHGVKMTLTHVDEIK